MRLSVFVYAQVQGMGFLSNSLMKLEALQKFFLVETFSPYEQQISANIKYEYNNF